MAMGIEVRR
jgi:hypothetical protein